MTQILLENAGYEISVDAQIGIGGLGTASLMGNTNYVFKQPFNTDDFDFDKIRWMVQHPLVSSHANHSFSWPADTGLDPTTKEPVGCLIPAATGALDYELLLVRWLPEAFRYRVLRNAAASLADLHRAQMVRGDWPNSMVDRMGRVIEIDLDSIAINRPDAQYPITATKPDTTSPEALENRQDAVFTEHDDGWGLPVCAWMLLFGEHPFACRWLGAGTRPKIHERIKQGLWPHDVAQTDVAPRRGSKPLSSLSSELQFLFRRVFSDGHSDPPKRPSAEDWLQAFAKLDATGDVSLTDTEWKCVADGKTPAVRRMALPRLSRLSLPGRKPIMTAASIALIGAGGYSMHKHSDAILERASTLPGTSQAAKWTGIKAVPSPASFEDQLEQIRDSRRTGQVSLHQFSDSRRDQTPALWTHLKNRK